MEKYEMTCTCGHVTRLEAANEDDESNEIHACPFHTRAPDKIDPDANTLAGHKVGETVLVTVPAGETKYKILNIS